MSDDRKSPGSALALARRRISLVALWSLVTALGPFALASAAASSMLEVEASNALRYSSGEGSFFMAEQFAL